MGIPHLAHYLRPYAESESLSGREVVIDGPGLAYHIYHVCLGRIRTTRNPFEAALSYRELGIATIAWLDVLRSSNVVVRKIYFDGYLPSSKLDTRIERLVRNTQQLLLFYQSNPVPCKVPYRIEDSSTQDKFASHPVHDNLTKLPALPFLVPAVLEALKASDKYGSITEVIPGEADPYCALSLQSSGGVVLTGDSDLLVHALGSDGTVAFFRDIEIISSGKSRYPEILAYRPAVIARRLNMPESHGINAIAFEMTMDPYASLKQLLVKAKALQSIEHNAEKYEDFKKEYALSSVMPTLRKEDSEALEVLRGLDPRTSEYVLQFPSIAKTAGQWSETAISDSTPHIFLPFLRDCPIRTNAWEMSMSIRQLAYGLINLIVPKAEQKRSVLEHKRQEGKFGGRELELPEPNLVTEACISLNTLLSQLEEKVLKISKAELWTAVAIYQEVEWSKYHSKCTLSQLMRSQLATLSSKANTDKILTWDILYLFAQIHASYNSFRILKQIISLVVAHSGLKSVPVPILQLQERLHSLPSLLELEDLSHVEEILGQIDRAGMILAAQEILGIATVELTKSHEQSKRISKKKRKRDNDTSTTQVEMREPTNRFELLGEE